MFSSKNDGLDGTELGWNETLDANNKNKNVETVNIEDFKKFEKKEDIECATENCDEFIYKLEEETTRIVFEGDHGKYPDRGYLIDFNSNRTLNDFKIQQLKSENWIDEDTRSI